MEQTATEISLCHHCHANQGLPEECMVHLASQLPLWYSWVPITIVTITHDTNFHSLFFWALYHVYGFNSVYDSDGLTAPTVDFFSWKTHFVLLSKVSASSHFPRRRLSTCCWKSGILSALEKVESPNGKNCVTEDVQLTQSRMKWKILFHRSHWG